MKSWLFPFVVPLLFPMGLFLSLLDTIAWFNYLSYKELSSIRHRETHGTTTMTS